MQQVIPLHTMPHKPNPDARGSERSKYRKHDIIERIFSWLKENHRICTRYDKLARSIVAIGAPACKSRRPRTYFPYKTYYQERKDRLLSIIIHPDFFKKILQIINYKILNGMP